MDLENTESSYRGTHTPSGINLISKNQYQTNRFNNFLVRVIVATTVQDFRVQCAVTAGSKVPLERSLRVCTLRLRHRKLRRRRSSISNPLLFVDI